jgi:hypothetical protein
MDRPMNTPHERIDYDGTIQVGGWADAEDRRSRRAGG